MDIDELVEEIGALLREAWHCSRDRADEINARLAVLTALQHDFYESPGQMSLLTVQLDQ